MKSSTLPLRPAHRAALALFARVATVVHLRLPRCSGMMTPASSSRCGRNCSSPGNDEAAQPPARQLSLNLADRTTTIGQSAFLVPTRPPPSLSTTPHFILSAVERSQKCKRPIFHRHFSANPASSPTGNLQLRHLYDAGEMGLGRFHVLVVRKPVELAEETTNQRAY